MSGGLAPSKSTIYVSNLPFQLTNNDLHKIFEKYGKVVKVTILRDKVTRQSKGVAFVLFLERDSAYQASKALNDTEMFNRRIKCSIAKDNGRASEFIRRKDYVDKSRCYECGEQGHLSYQCPSNLLGEREPPKKKERKRKTKEDSNQSDNVNAAGSDSDGNVDDPELDSLSAAINFQRQKIEQDVSRYGESLAGMSYSYQDNEEPRRKKYKKDAYFSDEEELDDND